MKALSLPTIFGLVVAGLTSCATAPTAERSNTATLPIQTNNLKADRTAALQTARAFVDAKLARHFDEMWDMSAVAYQRLFVAIGRGIAERDDTAARAQGFSSKDEVKGLSDREYFVRNRQAHADRKLFIYPKGVTVMRLAAGASLMVPFPNQRLRVIPITVTLSDGSGDKVGIARIGARWRVVSEHRILAASSRVGTQKK